MALGQRSYVSTMHAFDVVIRNGRVLDGTGAPWFKADVGMKGHKITKIGLVESASSDKVIDGTGLIVSPGFIDIHAHDDWPFIIDPRADSKARQGVTTELNGNCGISGGPIIEERLEEFRLACSLVGYSSALIRDIDPDWNTFGEYLGKVEEKGIPLNCGYYVGHTNIRVSVMGLTDRAPTVDEMDQMKSQVDEAMRHGAFGLSTALNYVPGRFAETREIIDLCRVVAKYGGQYAEHGRFGGNRILETTREAIEIGEKSGIPVILSHHTPPAEKHQEDSTVITEARNRGVDVIRDIIVYAYESGGPHSILPYWILEKGFEGIVEALRDKGIRRRLKEEIEKGQVDYLKEQTILFADRTPEFERKTWGEVAKLKRVDILDAVLDVMADNNLLVKTVWTPSLFYSEDTVIAALRDHQAIPETDSESFLPYGILAKRGDARGWGTFPLILGRYVREKRVLTLEEAIRRITSLPAQRMRLNQRGILREGMNADITVFNPDTILYKAEPLDPNWYPLEFPT